MPPMSLDAFELLRTVDAFYDAAWWKLLWVVGALGIIVGVVVPVLVQVYQRWVFRLEADKTRDQLREYVEKCVGDAMTREEAKAQSRWASFEEQVHAELGAIRSQVKKTLSTVWYIQGRMDAGDGYPPVAAGSFLMAIPGFIDAKDELNLRKCLRMAVDCLDESDREGLAMLREFQPDEEDNAIKKLEEFNENGRYTDDIRKLKRAIREAEERSFEAKA